jgi:SET domain-containing protein
MDHLILGLSRISGRGVFANTSFKNGEQITRVRGKLITYKKVPTYEQPIYLGTNKQVSDNIRKVEHHFIQIGRNLYINPSGPLFFINHSCNPNSAFKITGKKAVLVATKKIKKGEEITYDYSTTMDEDYWEMDCYCTSKNCRLRIRDFKYLPKKIQQNYIKLGIVTDYNRNHK